MLLWVWVADVASLAGRCCPTGKEQLSGCCWKPFLPAAGKGEEKVDLDRFPLAQRAEVTEDQVGTVSSESAPGLLLRAGPPSQK